MTRLANTALLTVLWAALFSTLDPRALAFGALVAWMILALCERFDRDPEMDGEPQALPKPIGTLLLGLAFIRELLLSGFAVAREAWRPKLAIRPGIVAVPLEVETDLEITVLSSLISLTPGTLSLEVSPDKKTLYVHGLVVDGDGDDVRASIKARLERPVKRAFWVIPPRAPGAESR